MTPKSLFRLPACTSTLEECANGRFQPIIADQGGADPARINRVLLCSGRIYYDLAKKREAEKRDDLAIVRMEELYRCRKPPCRQPCPVTPKAPPWSGFRMSRKTWAPGDSCGSCSANGSSTSTRSAASAVRQPQPGHGITQRPRTRTGQTARGSLRDIGRQFLMLNGPPTSSGSAARFHFAQAPACRDQTRNQIILSRNNWYHRGRLNRFS